MNPLGLVNIAQACTPDGGELGRCGQWKLKASSNSMQSRNDGIA